VAFDVALFPTESAQETVRLAKLVEKLGYNAVWVGDSHIIWREMYVLLGAIASQTKKIGIGSGVTHPHVRHLTLTASAFATLCELAKERVRIGIGIGASGPINIGVKRAARAELGQTVADLRRLFKGEVVQPDGMEMKLMYESGQDVPIYMAASTTPTRELAARIADGVIGGGRKDVIGDWVTHLRNSVRQAGRDVASVKIVSWISCSIDQDEKMARDAVKPHVARVGWTSFAKRMQTGQTVDEEDRQAVERLNREYDFSHHMGPEHSHLVPERWVDMFAVAGTPHQVRLKIEEVIKCGVDVISIVPYGNKEPIIREFAKKMLG
jgi:5,10-methylenetetrahydromethanopterin reductase